MPRYRWLGEPALFAGRQVAQFRVLVDQLLP
jgi:hypothetical protein